MKLSELHTGERAVIVKVAGHGGFRKRIVEMGFVKGREVKVILNAPLRDPIEYELLGYKISLRREEAGLVEVISEKEAKAQVRITSQGQNSLLPVSSVGREWIKPDVCLITKRREPRWSNGWNGWPMRKDALLMWL